MKTNTLITFGLIAALLLIASQAEANRNLYRFYGRFQLHTMPSFRTETPCPERIELAPSLLPDYTGELDIARVSPGGYYAPYRSLRLGKHVTSMVDDLTWMGVKGSASKNVISIEERQRPACLLDVICWHRKPRIKETTHLIRLSNSTLLMVEEYSDWDGGRDRYECFYDRVESF